MSDLFINDNLVLSQNNNHLKIIEIEHFREEIAALVNTTNGSAKVILLYHYYKSLFDSENQQIIEAYCLEFIEEYLSALNSFSPFYDVPEQTSTIIDQLKQLNRITMLSKYNNKIDRVSSDLTSRLKSYMQVLEGKNQNSLFTNEIKFPLIGKLSTNNDYILFNTIESLKIHIKPSKKSTSYIVIPSINKNEILEKQAQISFDIAIRFLDSFNNKFSRFHDIIIYFENQSAEYNGNSLGVALTIGFIEQLTVLYNLPFIIKFKNHIASTGGVNDAGEILSVGEQFLVNKVKAVFYSNIEIFIIAKQDDKSATEELIKLQRAYPNRNLKVIGIESIQDLLERRNIIDISKQSLFNRAMRFIKTNLLASILALFTLIFIGIFAYVEFDYNPAKIEATNDGYSICNKSNKVLWNIEQKLVLQNYLKTENLNAIDMNIRIIDLNNDKINEVIYCFDSNSIYANQDHSIGIVTLDNKGKMLNRFTFRKAITSARENISPPYGISIYDTLMFRGKRCILMSANNANSYGSALFLFNLSDNTVIGDTLWNSGHIIDARISDVNKDGIKDVTILSLNNGYKRAQFFNLNLDELRGQIPSTKEYMFRQLNLSKLNFLYLLPNTDFGKLINEGFTALRHRGLMNEKELNLIRFIALDGGYTSKKHLIFSYNTKTQIFDIAISSEFSRARDSLVSIGKLNKPYSDTKAYRKLLLSNIENWKGNNFTTIK